MIGTTHSAPCYSRRTPNASYFLSLLLLHNVSISLVTSLLFTLSVEQSIDCLAENARFKLLCPSVLVPDFTVKVDFLLCENTSSTFSLSTFLLVSSHC